MNKQQVLFVYDTIKLRCKYIRTSSRRTMYLRREKALCELRKLSDYFTMSLEMECFFERKISCACVESGHRSSEDSMAFGHKSSRRYN